LLCKKNQPVYAPRVKFWQFEQKAFFIPQKGILFDMNTQTRPVGQVPATDQLLEQFREVMRLPAEPPWEAALREGLQRLMAALLLQEGLKTDAMLQHMLLACRLRLRALQNLCAGMRRPAQFFEQPCDLLSLVEDHCAAADLLLGAVGRGVCFSSGESQMEVYCAPHELGWLLLEMICNAALHTPGAAIDVALECKSGANPCLLLRTQSEGGIDLARLHRAAAKPGSGACAMLRTASLHQGSLLWCGEGDRSVCALRLPLRQNGAAQELALPFDPPDFMDLLYDQLSPVYTALAPCIGC
jgi:hypothetical protein